MRDGIDWFLVFYFVTLFFFVVIMVTVFFMIIRDNTEENNEVPDWENSKIYLGKKITSSNKQDLLPDISSLYVPGTSMRKM